MLNKITDTVGRVAGPVSKVAIQVAEAGAASSESVPEPRSLSTRSNAGSAMSRSVAGARIAAETTIDADETATVISKLARYIRRQQGQHQDRDDRTGGPEQGQKIAMTAGGRSAAARRAVGDPFFMPSSQTMDAAHP